MLKIIVDSVIIYLYVKLTKKSYYIESLNISLIKYEYQLQNNRNSASPKNAPMKPGTNILKPCEMQ